MVPCKDCLGKVSPRGVYGKSEEVGTPYVQYQDARVWGIQRETPTLLPVTPCLGGRGSHTQDEKRCSSPLRLDKLFPLVYPELRGIGVTNCKADEE